jgi:hypothetical protein
VDSRTQVHIYGPDTQQAETYTATVWPAQNFTRDGYSTREEAQEAFPALYKLAHATEKAPEDFRFFGPIYVSAELRELANGTWEAIAWGDRPYSVVAPTEQEAKDAFIAMYNEEFPDIGSYPEPFTDQNYDWTYNTGG